MSRITEGHLVRHYQGAKGGRDAALLDIAQDHALFLLHQAGLFPALEGLALDGPAQITNAESALDGLLHIERSRLRTRHWQKCLEVGPANLSPQ